MDKKIFLLDKDYYREEQISNLTEKDLEEWVVEDSYTENFTILKIDANDYSSIEDAFDGECIICPEEDYYIFSFGF